MNKSNTTPKEPNSTKELIVERANEIVNSIGMVDFRIDYLAKSLDISPGNITYHFPRKDDISAAVWSKFTKEVVSSIDSYITPFIDIKQLYLFFRNIISIIYSYRGVVSYMMGDSGVIVREKRFNSLLWRAFEDKYNNIDKLLLDNGYINSDKDEYVKQLTFESQVVYLVWWANHAYSAYNDDIAAYIDYYAMVVLFPLRTKLTEKGLEQFIAINSLVTNV